MKKLYLLGVGGVCLIILLFRFLFFYHSQNIPANGEQLSFLTSVDSVPNTVNGKQRFSVQLSNGPRVFISTKTYPKYEYGQKIAISGTISHGWMSFPEIRAVEQEKPMVLALLDQLRQNIQAVFRRSLPATDASLMLGIAFGIKEPVSDQQFSDQIKATGLMHIVAASGMNVSIISAFFMTLFGRFLRRQVAICLVIGSTLLYAILSGLEPSIVRATIMCSFALAAGLLGRQYTSIWALGLTAYSMLLYDPALLTDIGFQLSFAATAGIMFSPFLEHQTNQGATMWSIITQDMKTTTAAQLATLPIMFGNFGDYGLLSILVNTLVLWTIPPLMMIGIVGGLVGVLVEPLGKLVLWFSLPLLAYFHGVVGMLGKYNLMLHSESWPWSLQVGYYLLLVAVYLKLHKKKTIVKSNIS